ncbi:uncharacterized protein LOC116924927, partial [Daphnia magna]|uniref:uncharacterized protein LOC116924927 n=1 Tax=Daphnia magna TaxID=35525 RepID=UPI001E1BABE3
ITIPRNFQAKSQKDKLKFVEKARNEKTEIGVSWPSEGCELSSRPKRGISTYKENDSTTTLKAIILNFSDDKEVIEDVQTQLINKKKPRAKPAATNSYRSNAGKSQAETPKVLSSKDINVASKTSVQEHLPDNNATNQSKTCWCSTNTL